jgi:hypothetical protein
MRTSLDFRDQSTYFQFPCYRRRALGVSVQSSNRMSGHGLEKKNHWGPKSFAFINRGSKWCLSLFWWTGPDPQIIYSRREKVKSGFYEQVIVRLLSRFREWGHSVKRKAVGSICTPIPMLVLPCAAHLVNHLEWRSTIYLHLPDPTPANFFRFPKVKLP